MGLWRALERTMECQQLCQDISWLDCGKLRYHAFSDELVVRADSATPLGIALAAGVVLGLILSWIPNRISCLIEQLHRKSMASASVSDANIVPKHVAVIMDGNRRFGRIRYGDPLKGHWEGGQVLLDFVQWCVEGGIKLVTVYAFSSENWTRDAVEIELLMTMFGKYAATMAEEASKRNVKVKILSTDFQRLPPHVQRSVEALESATAGCTGLLLNVCLSYGARADIAQACTRAVSAVFSRGLLGGKSDDVVMSERGGGDMPERDLSRGVEESKGEQKDAKQEKQGKVAPAAPSWGEEMKKGEGGPLVVTEAMLSEHLCTAGLPDPDLLLRTSGEVRISNFLLWQLAYTEMFFVPKFWPEICRDDFRDILRQFAERKRRFGA